MDTTVAKSAKRQTAPARPKAAHTVKSASPKKASQTATAKRPKATAAGAKVGKKAAAKPSKKVSAKKSTVKSAPQKLNRQPAAQKTAPAAAPRGVSKTKSPAVSPDKVKRATSAAPLVQREKSLPPPLVAKTANKRPPTETQKQLQAQQKANQAALKVFEHALRAFYRHDYAAACKGFNQIIEEFGSEVEVAPRARDYSAICEQRLERPKNVPRSSEALYSQGVYELNAGHYEKAVSLLERAAKMEPNSAYIVYSLGAAQAQSNDLDAALDSLRRAVLLQEGLRMRARRDPDFANLMDNDDFRHLVGIESEPPLVL